MRKLVLLTALAASATAIDVQLAVAASAFPTTGSVFVGPRFAAGGVAWAERTREQGFFVQLSNESATRRVLTRKPEPRTIVEPRITGGAELLVGITTSSLDVPPGYPPEPRASEYALVQPDGAVHPLERCEPGRPAETLEGDGDRFGSVRLDCSRGVVVREAASGTELVLPFSGSSPRLAGRFVALIAPTTGPPSDIVVYDWRAGREVHRVRTSRLREPVRRLDVRADGAVAFEHPVRGGIAWSSPSRPRIHRLRLPRRERYQVRWHGRSILFAAGDEQGSRLPRAQLGLATLAGRRRVLARNVPVVNEGFDSDGRRITYLSLRCGLRVVVRRLREREPRCAAR